MLRFLPVGLFSANRVPEMLVFPEFAPRLGKYGSRWALAARWLGGRCVSSRACCCGRALGSRGGLESGRTAPAVALTSDSTVRALLLQAPLRLGRPGGCSCELGPPLFYYIPLKTSYRQSSPGWGLTQHLFYIAFKKHS